MKFSRRSEKKTKPSELDIKKRKNKIKKEYLKIPSKIFVEPTIQNLTELRKMGYTPVQVTRFIYNTLNYETIFDYFAFSGIPKFEQYNLSTKYLQQRAPAAIMLKIGFTLKDLKNSNYTAKELIDLVPPRKLRENGYTARTLLQAGLDAKQIYEAGFTLSEMVEAGFGPKTLLSIGYSKNIIKKVLERKAHKRYNKYI